MQCPKCHSDNFEIGKPCPQCGFRGNASRRDELEQFNMEAPPVFKLKGLQTSHPKGPQAASEVRLPAFAKEETEKAWVELGHLETLFVKVQEWRAAGYFKSEMTAQDPVKMQRTRADELRQRLEEYPRPALTQTSQDRLKTVSFLLDAIDLLDSRGWFNKKDLEKVVAPVMAMIADAISDNTYDNEYE